MSRHPEIEDAAGRGPRDRETLDHVRRCPECLRALAGEEPSRLFALLSSRPIDAAILDAVSRGVRREMSSDTAPRRPARSPGLAVAAAWAAAAALAGLLLVPPRPPATRASVDRPGGRAEVALVSSPGTPEVVDLSVGDVQLVMIFDREMDL